MGSPKEANHDCGYDYTAAALVSTRTVVLVVHADPGIWPDGPDINCGMSGRIRSAVVRLPEPLGTRALLDLTTGQPIQRTP
ncbi:hypothetical protein [Nakamurella endophytica]|uniref:hypothetical protein n=1 Tax=Nakamurella endophytica TaxID=1748367 RepID=UPI001664D217|nr:hypothetical protein [Nakamurella endophytica]